jgi:hypothetical protein
MLAKRDQARPRDNVWQREKSTQIRPRTELAYQTIKYGGEARQCKITRDQPWERVSIVVKHQQ